MAPVRVWRRAAGAAAMVFAPAMVAASCSSNNSHPGELGAEDSGARSYDSEVLDTGTRQDSTTHIPDTGAPEAGCDAGQTMCSGACTNTNTDPHNCGQCTNACPQTQSCVGGTCTCQPDAGLSLCNNTCINTESDPANCGACGRNCQGSICANGLCVPTVVAQPGQLIADIAVDNTYMYWTQSAPSGLLVRKPIAGGNAVNLIDGLKDPRGVAIAVATGPSGLQFGQKVSTVDNSASTVWQVDTNIGPVSKQQLWPPTNADAGVMAPPAPIDVAVDDHAIYWVAYGTTDNTGQVLSIPIGGSGTVPPTVIADKQDFPVAIAVDATNVYWINTGNQSLNNGTVNQAPKQGGAMPTQVAQNLASPWDIAVDATSIYWTEKTNPGAVKRAPIGGGAAPTTLAQLEGAPTGIAVDLQPPTGSTTAYVYWTDFVDNQVKRLPVTGGGMPFVLASGGDTINPSAITVDKVSVYWVSQGKNEILSVPQ